MFFVWLRNALHNLYISLDYKARKYFGWNDDINSTDSFKFSRRLKELDGAGAITNQEILNYVDALYSQFLSVDDYTSVRDLDLWLDTKYRNLVLPVFSNCTFSLQNPADRDIYKWLREKGNGLSDADWRVIARLTLRGKEGVLRQLMHRGSVFNEYHALIHSIEHPDIVCQYQTYSIFQDEYLQDGSAKYIKSLVFWTERIDSSSKNSRAQFDAIVYPANRKLFFSKISDADKIALSYKIKDEQLDSDLIDEIGALECWYLDKSFTAWTINETQLQTLFARVRDPLDCLKICSALSNYSFANKETFMQKSAVLRAKCLELLDIKNSQSESFINLFPKIAPYLTAKHVEKLLANAHTDKKFEDFLYDVYRFYAEHLSKDALAVFMKPKYFQHYKTRNVFKDMAQSFTKDSIRTFLDEARKEKDYAEIVLFLVKSVEIIPNDARTVLLDEVEQGFISKNRDAMMLYTRPDNERKILSNFWFQNVSDEKRLSYADRIVSFLNDANFGSLCDAIEAKFPKDSAKLPEDLDFLSHHIDGLMKFRRYDLALLVLGSKRYHLSESKIWTKEMIKHNNFQLLYMVSQNTEMLKRATSATGCPLILLPLLIQVFNEENFLQDGNRCEIFAKFSLWFLLDDGYQPQYDKDNVKQMVENFLVENALALSQALLDSGKYEVLRDLYLYLNKECKFGTKLNLPMFADDDTVLHAIDKHTDEFTDAKNKVMNPIKGLLGDTVLILQHSNFQDALNLWQTLTSISKLLLVAKNPFGFDMLDIVNSMKAMLLTSTASLNCELFSSHVFISNISQIKHANKPIVELLKIGCFIANSRALDSLVLCNSTDIIDIDLPLQSLYLPSVSESIRLDFGNHLIVIIDRLFSGVDDDLNYTKSLVKVFVDNKHYWQNLYEEKKALCDSVIAKS